MSPHIESWNTWNPTSQTQVFYDTLDIFQTSTSNAERKYVFLLRKLPNIILVQQ